MFVRDGKSTSREMLQSTDLTYGEVAGSTAVLASPIAFCMWSNWIWDIEYDHQMSRPLGSDLAIPHCAQYLIAFSVNISSPDDILWAHHRGKPKIL